MPTTEWIGFAAEMVVLTGGLTAISVWMSKRFDDIQRSMDRRFGEVRDEIRQVRGEMRSEIGLVRGEMRSEIGLVRDESREALRRREGSHVGARRRCQRRDSRPDR